MTNLIPLSDDQQHFGGGHSDGGGAVSVLAAERAAFEATRAARARHDSAEAMEVARADARYRVRVEAAVGIAAAAASRAATWVEELAARTGSRRRAGYAAAVLACGRDLDPGDDEDGGVHPDLAFVLSGLILVDENGLAEGEGLALAAADGSPWRCPARSPSTTTRTASCPSSPTTSTGPSPDGAQRRSVHGRPRAAPPGAHGRREGGQRGGPQALAVTRTCG
ncbi:hypothetical protein ACFXPX_37445 [Kitasatospora sp. NPDC059146]|uniref:hypothetical protein n=1 Tax=Kitasatospora sp. NPDC059146 TaxID=3346741 RepID=UPI0036892698